MYIEFVGLPGSGKTTIANEVLNRIRLVEIDTVSKNDIIKNKVNRFKGIGYFKRLYMLIRFARVNRCYSSYKRIIATWIDNNAIMNHKGSRVIDQGLIQDLLSILHFKKVVKQSITHTVRIIDEFIRDEDTPIIVYVSSPLEVNLRRIRNRNGEQSRADKMNSEELQRLMSIQKSNLESILNCMTGYRVIHVNNAENSNPSLLADTIFHQIFMSSNG